VSANAVGKQVRLRLDDASERWVDHVLLATGYQVDVSRCAFLAPELMRSLRITNGYPELAAGFESSLPRLHFIGAAAAGAFGPLMCFVAGTKYAARALTRSVLAREADSAKDKTAFYFVRAAQANPDGNGDNPMAKGTGDGSALHLKQSVVAKTIGKQR